MNLPNFTAIGEDVIIEDFVIHREGQKSPEEFVIKDVVDLMKNPPEDAKKVIEAMPDGAIDEIIAKWSGAD